MLSNVTIQRLYTENPFVDSLLYFTKILAYGSVIKMQDIANANETKQSANDGDVYILIEEGRETFDIFDYTKEQLLAAGVSVSIVDKCLKDKNEIPEACRLDLCAMGKEAFLARFEEKNNYYRMITGLPDYGDYGIPIKNYEYLIGKFKEENVFGIFAFGKVNTEEGIQDISELTTEGIIFPTFKEICLNKRPPLKTIENNIIIKDIRCIFNDITLTQNDPITEALFTDYRIINVKYLRFFEKYFYDKKEKIHNRISIKDSEATNLLETGLTELLRNVLNINSTSINFLKSLTDSEKVALSAIIEKINEVKQIIYNNYSLK